MKPLIVFGCVVKWKAVAIRKEDIRFLLLENRIVRIADIYVFSCEGPLCSLSFEFERYGAQAHYENSGLFRFRT